jgi:hypothetical protein
MTETESALDSSPGALESSVGVISRALAVRLTRRSALSRLGRYGVALSIGSAGAALLDEQAFGTTVTGCCGSCTIGNCCGSDSVWCSDLPGWNQNSCPTGSCGCGSWTHGTCADGRILRYADCCGGCNNGGNCTCINGAPSCCRHQLHTNGSCNDCCGYWIKCRRWFCS